MNIQEQALFTKKLFGQLDNAAEITALIQGHGVETLGIIVRDLIMENVINYQRVSELYRAYIGQVPITSRRFENLNKLNNRLVNDFRGDIIDGGVGYLFGNPISYSICDDNKTPTQTEELQAKLKAFLRSNNIEDLDSVTGKMAAICGYAYRLAYIDKQGEERIMNINPWEALTVNDTTLDVVQYGMIYYPVKMIINGGTVIERTKVEWYDNKNVTFLVQDTGGNYGLDPDYPNNPMPHMFDEVPLIKFINNDAEQGDFEKVESLIDSYDRVMSDIQNEVEEFRLAYMGFFGIEPTSEGILAMRQTGGIGIPEGGDIKFITKDLNGAVGFLENHKNTLYHNIYTFSKAVNMSDENFSGGAQSGESRKWKLVGLENKAITKERKFTRASRQMFKCIFTAWKKKLIKVDVNDLEIQFSRNLPIDLAYIADVLMKLKGSVSEETRLSLAPFITDVDSEIEQMKEDAAGGIDLDSLGNAPAPAPTDPNTDNVLPLGANAKNNGTNG